MAGKSDDGFPWTVEDLKRNAEAQQAIRQAAHETQNLRESFDALKISIGKAIAQLQKARMEIDRDLEKARDQLRAYQCWFDHTYWFLHREEKLEQFKDYAFTRHMDACFEALEEERFPAAERESLLQQWRTGF